MPRLKTNSEIDDLVVRIRNVPPIPAAEIAALQVSWLRRDMGISVDEPPMTDLPPLTQHKPKIVLNSKAGLPSVRIKVDPNPLSDHELSGWKELIKNHNPTPTISQMLDRRDQAKWADQARVYLKWGWIILAVIALAVVGLALVFGVV
ncbi:MAG: hypothetical protein ACJAZ1_002081 [Yoonia sp.]|jgi:hypothetical protein